MRRTSEQPGSRPFFPKLASPLCNRPLGRLAAQLLYHGPHLAEGMVVAAPLSAADAALQLFQRLWSAPRRGQRLRGHEIAGCVLRVLLAAASRTPSARVPSRPGWPVPSPAHSGQSCSLGPSPESLSVLQSCPFSSAPPLRICVIGCDCRNWNWDIASRSPPAPF